MPDDRYREPGWKSEPSPAGLQRDLRAQFDPDEETDASFRRPRTAAGVGVPLRTATPATGIPGLVERVTSRPVRAPVRARSPVAGELVVADGVPQLAPAGADETGVHELESIKLMERRLHRELGGDSPLARPLAKIIVRQRRQSEAQGSLLEAVTGRAELERASIRRERATFWLSLVSAIAPTLLAAAALAAALHGSAQLQPVDPPHQVQR